MLPATRRKGICSFGLSKPNSGRTMTYSLLRYAHLIGVMLLGAGLIGVWISDLRSRKVRDLGLFAEAIRNIAVFYGGLLRWCRGARGHHPIRLWHMDDSGCVGWVGMQEHVPTFTHFLDIPMLLLIVSLGVIKPSTWTQFIIGAIGALAMATVLTLWIPRLYPWIPPTHDKSSLPARHPLQMVL